MKLFIAPATAVLVSTCVSASELIEETITVGQHDTRVIELIDAASVSPDPADLIKKAPGANIVRNGPLTGIPQVRGLFGPRVAVALDDTFLAPAGPNWMDPPISYAATAQLESLTVYRGISPVSIAQESLGGLVIAKTRRLDFSATSDWETTGLLVGSAQAVNNGYQIDADVQAANDSNRFRGAIMLQSGDDASFATGTLLPTEYERERYDIGYGFRWGDHSVQIDVGHLDTGVSGTPALPMDIDYVTGNAVDLSYRYKPSEESSFEVTAFGSDLNHGMTNYHLRAAQLAAVRYLRNIAVTDNVGFRIQAEVLQNQSRWRFGIDGFEAKHASDIDNPNNAAFFVINFNDAQRRVLGAYIEQELESSDTMQVEWGARLNQVKTNARAVNGTPAMMMPPATALRDQFNDADRSKSDVLADIFGKVNWQIADDLKLYLGVAQKQRAPSYQERYLWLPLEATGGLADGQLYTGSIDLEPETASQLEFGFDYVLSNFSIQPRFFTHHISDYIQGVASAASSNAARFVAAMNTMNDSNRQPPLVFSNVDARLYGFDVDWRWQLAEDWEMGGLLSYVRGERRDISDDLYRIAPINATTWISVRSRSVLWRFEAEVYGPQRNVSIANRESESAGYAVANLGGEWEISEALSFTVGVNNVFDRQFAPHLGGYNRSVNPDVGIMERLPAQGRNVFARAIYRL